MHDRHCAAAPAVGMYAPAEQATQLRSVVVVQLPCRTVPALQLAVQLLHCDMPVCDWNRPTAQPLHAVMLFTPLLKLPAPHASHEGPVVAVHWPVSA